MLHTVISPLLRSCVIHSRLQTNLFECKIWPRKYICLQKSYEIHSRECQFPIRSSSPKRMYNIGNMRTKDYTLIVVNTSGVLRPSHHLWQIASLNNFAQCFLGNHQHPRTLAILETQKSDFPPSNPRHTWGPEVLLQNSGRSNVRLVSWFLIRLHFRVSCNREATKVTLGSHHHPPHVHLIDHNQYYQYVIGLATLRNRSTKGGAPNSQLRVFVQNHCV